MFLFDDLLPGTLDDEEERRRQQEALRNKTEPPGAAMMMNGPYAAPAGVGQAPDALARKVAGMQALLRAGRLPGGMASADDFNDAGNYIGKTPLVPMGPPAPELFPGRADPTAAVDVNGNPRLTAAEMIAKHGGTPVGQDWPGVREAMMPQLFDGFHGPDGRSSISSNPLLGGRDFTPGAGQAMMTANGPLAVPHPNDQMFDNGLPTVPKIWTEADLEPTSVLGSVGSRFTPDSHGYTTPSPNLPLFRADMAQRQFANRILAETMAQQHGQEFQASENEKNRQAQLQGKPDRKEQAFAKGIALAGDPKIPSAMAKTEIDRMVQNGDLTAEDGNTLSLERRLRDPQTGHPLVLGKLGDFQAFAGKLDDQDPATVRNFLEKNRGVTRDAAVKRLAALYGEGTSFFNTHIRTQYGHNPVNYFDRNALSPEQRTEYDFINRIYGKQ